MKQLDKLLQDVAEAQLELQKTQERIVLSALIAAAREQLAEQGENLKTSLDRLGQAAQSRIRTKVSLGIEGVFEGKAADSAQGQLSRLAAPSFGSPIRV
ncbi:hypothetical protein [Streptococcus mutans]|uniref:hypothetical protein n=1 Tax=Streptococcus mutans TaxID=1309 RepID=UPI00046453A6|nr:hypothetical protein [Streptococcus mutans]